MAFAFIADPRGLGPLWFHRSALDRLGVIVASFEFRFVVGVSTDLRPDLVRDPLGFRQQQRAVVKQVDLPGWSAVVPERYSETATQSRPPEGDQAALRTWDAQSVGITRMPVGLVRMVEDDPGSSHFSTALPDGWGVRSRYVTLWPDGAGVLVMVCAVETDTARLTDLRATVDREIRARLSAEAEAVGSSAADAVARALRAAGLGENLPAGGVACRFVGRHRLWRLDAAPIPELLLSIRESLVNIGRESEFQDVSSEPGTFCFPGNGASVEVGLGRQQRESMLAPVLEYYEYWIAAITTMDDSLHSAYSELVSADSHHVQEQVRGNRDDSLARRRAAAWNELARDLFFAHRDVLSAMSPQHYAAWQALLPTWRISELEEDIKEKIGAIEEVNRYRREEESNRIAFSTTTVVTFLTALTLISIVTGVAAFIITEEAMATAVRVVLVVISAAAALMLFALTFSTGVVRLMRRTARRRRVGR